MKFLEGKIRIKLIGMGFGNDLLNLIPKVQATNSKIKR